MWWLYTIAVPILLYIAYQDFKERAVTWFLFPIVFILGIIQVVLANEYWTEVLMSLSFVMIIFLSLTIYYSIKYRKLHVIIDQELGLGDVLFLLILPLFMSSIYFLTFFVLSNLVAVMVFGLILIKERNRIPLAGVQALMLALVLLLTSALNLSLYDSQLILSLVSLG